MNTIEAASLARDLMDEFGLTDWWFVWDRSVRRFGQCRSRAKQIGLSGALTELNDRADVEDCIRHEIAHALPGGGGHGPGWRANCRITGARPERCYDSSKVTQPKAPWTACCKTCGWSVPRHRRGRNLICKTCGWTVTWEAS